MCSRHLPAQPSLRHLKNEAKQLHKALLDGDDGAVSRVHVGLPRLGEKAAVDDVTLMEAQHVLAGEYGYREWRGLAAAAELDFEGLAALSDEDATQLLRETDQKDVVVALKNAGEAVSDRLLERMSLRVRTFILEEMESLGPMPADEITEVQSRIVEQVRLLARAGSITWPPGSDTPPPQRRTEDALEPALATIGRSLDSLQVEEIRAVIHGLSVRARAHGILSLEEAAKVAGDGFVREGIRLVVDGTEPDQVEDFLKTRSRAVLQHMENRLQVIVEAMAAICGGDNPRLIAHKLTCVYRADFDAVIEPTGATLDDLAVQLQEPSASAWDLDRLATWLTDLSEIARRQGLAALAPLTEAIGDPALQTGVRLLAARASMKDLVEALYSLRTEVLAASRQRLWLFTAGITAVQRAAKEGDLDTIMDEAIQQATEV